MDSQVFAEACAARRLVTLMGQVDQKMFESFTSQLQVFRDAKDRPVVVLLASTGGGVNSGFTIYNVLRAFAKSANVYLVASSTVQSSALAMMMAVPKARRFAFPYTTFYAHRVSLAYEFKGPPLDLETQRYANLEHAALIETSREGGKMINEVVAAGTGMSVAEVEALSEAPRFLGTEEARKLGFISGILE